MGGSGPAANESQAFQLRENALGRFAGDAVAGVDHQVGVLRRFVLRVWKATTHHQPRLAKRSHNYGKL